ncbi:MAG: molybdate ABC transporter substrate-binding protein [Candidatus Omnitrophica bacterium]|nr:molybdate ABC transporter substrate-binding protein [Candidatus Omnitrophota bacterium]
MKRGILVGFLILVLGISLITGYKMTSYKRVPLEIYVPCGMIVPLQEVIRSFESENRGTKVEAYYDTGAVLVRLILNKGKRPDIFVSTGDVEMKNLAERGLINTETIREFGKFYLVLYASSSNPAGVSNINDLNKPEVKTIAISDPRFNSVGNYAKEALENLAIWNDVKEKIVFTDSPIQALTFVASEKAQVGIHYNICPFDTAPEKMSIETVKIIQEIPQEYYRPIASQIAILNDTRNKRLPSLFLQFLFSEKGQKVLKDYGIECPTESISKIPTVAVKIEAYFPFNEEHKFIADYLKTFEKKFPGKVSLRLIDFRSPDGYDQWRKSGLSCGGVLINGMSAFDIETPDGPKTIRFLRRLDTFWTREDFEKVLLSEIKKIQKQEI